MNPYIIRALCLLLGYGFGLILSGYFIGRANHVDLRKEGSGNVGTTNTLRTLGLKAGFLTLILDAAKTMAAVGIAWLCLHEYAPQLVRLYMLYAGFGAVMGHDFPFYFKFKGGKGVASSFGLVLVLFPQCLPICALIFFLCVAITRYVSLGSILAAAALTVQVVVFGLMGWLNFPTEAMPEVYVIGLLLGGICIFLHRANIDRLIHHKENKFSFHPNTKK